MPISDGATSDDHQKLILYSSLLFYLTTHQKI